MKKSSLKRTDSKRHLASSKPTTDKSKKPKYSPIPNHSLNASSCSRDISSLQVFGGVVAQRKAASKGINYNEDSADESDAVFEKSASRKRKTALKQKAKAAAPDCDKEPTLHNVNLKFDDQLSGEDSLVEEAVCAINDDQLSIDGYDENDDIGKSSTQDSTFRMPSPPPRFFLDLDNFEPNDSSGDDDDDTARVKDENSKQSHIPVKVSDNDLLGQCPHCRSKFSIPSTPYRIKAYGFTMMANNEKGASHQDFCRIHKNIEDVTMDGKQHKYPTHIDTETIQKRVRALQGVLEAVILGVEPCEFKNMANENYEKYGKKSKTMKFKYPRFHLTQCGYYGRTGYSAINRAICKMCEKSTRNDTTIQSNSIIRVGKSAYEPQQKYQDYLAEVLIPEMALRLIAEDRKVNLSRARVIMQESSAFGAAMFDEDSDHDAFA